MMENTKKDSPDGKQEDSKAKVLELQELDEVAGGTGGEEWSVRSIGCVVDDWSTHSGGC